MSFVVGNSNAPVIVCISKGMGQPGKVQTTLLTPVDVVKAEWLSKSSSRNPEMLAVKPPKPKIVEIAKDLPEYIVDPGTKTTYLKGKFLGKVSCRYYLFCQHMVSYKISPKIISYLKYIIPENVNNDDILLVYRVLSNSLYNLLGLV